jgi:F0F1-type ATP synthase assembly protein I
MAVMPDSRPRPPDAREMRYYFSLAQVGLEMVVPLILGLVMDYYAGTIPWFAISGLVLGFVGGITHLVVLGNKHDAATRDQRGSKPP